MSPPNKPPRSKIDDMLDKAMERTKQAEIVIENQKEYALAVNRVFSTNEGKLVAEYMFKFIGLFDDPPLLNPAGLIEEKGKKSYYLKMIRPYLEKKLRMEIENL